VTLTAEGILDALKPRARWMCSVAETPAGEKVPMPELRIAVRHEVGLHARPAALFVQTANRFGSKITVQNLTSPGPAADAKSIIGILTLGVARDHEILIEASGADADTALAALHKLISDNFGGV
jgi:phosphotransferase system HPr (HPr) family protein